MSTERNWLQITESVSIVASGVGTIAAAFYGQAAMAAVPLTAALALNFASRQRLREQIELDTRSGISQLGRIVELIRQEVDKLPKKQPDITPITESVLRLQELSLSLANRQEELGQQFQKRSEIQTIAALEKNNAALREELTALAIKIDNFPISQPVDLSGIEGKTDNLRTQLEDLYQQFSGRPEVVALPQMQQENSNVLQQIKQEIGNLQSQLLAVSQQLEDRIELQALPEIQQETSDAIAKLQEVETEIGNLNEQLLALSAQFNSRTEIAALPQLQQETVDALGKIEEKISNLRSQSETIAAQFSNRPEIALLPQLQQETSNTFQKIEADISNLRSYIDNLSNEFNQRPEIVALPQMQQEVNKALQQLQLKINDLQKQLETVNEQFSNRAEVSQLSQKEEKNRIGILHLQKLIEQEINYQREQLSALTEYFINRPEVAALPEIRLEISNAVEQIKGEIGNLNSQLENLESQFNQRPEIETIPQMQQETSSAVQEIKGEIGNLNSQLENLESEFNQRPEIVAIPQMQQETSNAVEQIKGEIGNLNTQLENLESEFSTRPEINAIANLEATVNALLEPPKLSNWPGVKVKAIGIGESGRSAIEKLISNQLTGIDFWLIDSDSHTLELSADANKLQIGESLTQGKGMGGDAAIAKIAGEEARQQIEAAIQSSDLVFIMAGMGGGTGTGVAPIIAEIAKENGALTVGIVTHPFVHEGKNRAILAEEGISALQEKTDMLVVITIDKVFSSISEWTPIQEAFQVVNDLKLQAVQGICNIINNRGLVNVNFADLKQAIASSGSGGIGMGVGVGKSRAKTAAMAAISSPLMQVANKAAKTVILSINGPSNLSVQEVNEAAEIIKEFVGEEANIMLGAGIDERLVEEVRVTAIATSLS